MGYSDVHLGEVDKKRLEHDVGFTKEFLFACDNYLDFRFKECCRKDDPQDESLYNQSEAQGDVIDDCHFDENERERGHQILELVEVSSFVAAMPNNSCEPVYMIKITEKENTAEKMKFSVKDFFSKCDQIRRFLRIWSYLLKKSLTENFIFCAVEADEEVNDLYGYPKTT